MGIRQRYLFILIVTGIAAIVLTGATNLIIDPYGTFRFVTIDRLNRIKPYPDHDIATIKARALRHVQPDSLILGNSRAEVGFDPTHPAWKQNGYSSVYNAAIAGSSLSTARDQLQKAAVRSPPKMILLGLDFFDFPIAPDKKIAPRPDVKDNWLDDARWKLRATLTMQALLDSAATLRNQYQQNPKQLTDRGHNPLLEYKDIARTDGYWVLFRQRAEDNAKNHGRKPANLFLRDTRSSPELDDVRRIIQWTVQNDAELRLVIYPYHAQLLVMIDELGLWPVFEEWKREIVSIIDNETARPEVRNHIVLLDFSGFSDYAQERIPPKGDKNSVTHWYWEAGHFKKELGDLMIPQCLSPMAVSPTTDFGIVLLNDNIELHLERQRAAKSLFKAANPISTTEIRELVRKAKDQTRTNPGIISP